MSIIQAWLNLCGFKPVAYSNTDDFEVNGSAPVTGFYAPADCANPTVVDAVTYHYSARSADGTQHEEGNAVWDNATSTLLRAAGTVRNSSNSGALVNFSAVPIVRMGNSDAGDMIRAGNLAVNMSTAGLEGAINIAGDPVVIWFNASENAFTSLNANFCTALQRLQVQTNSLTALTIGGCSSILEVRADGNQLTSLDCSSLTTLHDLIVSSNSLTSLDLSGCTALAQLDVSFNTLTALDVSDCTHLGLIDASFNSITSMDLSASTVFLGSCNLQNNPITSLDVTGCTNLSELIVQQSAPGGGLTSYDASQTPNLSILNLISNSLTTLDVSMCSVLQNLFVNFNVLTSITLPTVTTELVDFELSSNQLTSLDVTGFSSLVILDASDNLITSIVVTGCVSLTGANVRGNALTQSVVDQVLADLDTAGLSGGNVDLSAGTSSAPSAAGLVSKANLEGKGWTVTVN